MRYLHVRCRSSALCRHAPRRGWPTVTFKNRAGLSAACRLTLPRTGTIREACRQLTSLSSCVRCVALHRDTPGKETISPHRLGGTSAAVEERIPEGTWKSSTIYPAL